jgi:hypothetical protein
MNCKFLYFVLNGGGLMYGDNMPVIPVLGVEVGGLWSEVGLDKSTRPYLKTKAKSAVVWFKW